MFHMAFLSVFVLLFASTQKLKKTLSWFTLSVITNKIHNYISIYIVYLYFLYFNICCILAFVYSNFSLGLYMQLLL